MQSCLVMLVGLATSTYLVCTCYIIRVSNMVRKNPSPRELSPKLHGSFLPKSDFETFGHTGRDSEAFLGTWFFSGCFYQTRIPESATLATKTFITHLIITILVAICAARAPLKAAAAHMKGFDRQAIAAAVLV